VVGAVGLGDAGGLRRLGKDLLRPGAVEKGGVELGAHGLNVQRVHQLAGLKNADQRGILRVRQRAGDRLIQQHGNVLPGLRQPGIGLLAERASENAKTGQQKIPAECRVIRCLPADELSKFFDDVCHKGSSRIFETALDEAAEQDDG
jgi:peptidoglycan/xylan/chitin deacetylase (PgdA/CDA1 family)